MDYSHQSEFEGIVVIFEWKGQSQGEILKIYKPIVESTCLGITTFFFLKI